MRLTVTVAVAAVAITLAGCSRRPEPPLENLPPPPVETVDPNAGALPGADIEPIELPAAQADLVAKAGSDTVYFGTDEHVLDEASRATLAAQAQWLLANPSVRASLEGHADERGTREYNLALGERRANAARDFLVAQGVPASRLLVVSWGKERPVAQGSNEMAWAQNRRAVTVVVR